MGVEMYQRAQEGLEGRACLVLGHGPPVQYVVQQCASLHELKDTDLLWLHVGPLQGHDAQVPQAGHLVRLGQHHPLARSALLRPVPLHPHDLGSKSSLRLMAAHPLSLIHI